MIKVADKLSQDPVQQKLRQAKKQWNKDVSAFIDDLIHFKKLTNGQPNKFFKEKGTIKEPIPADPVTIIGSLANDFQQLTQVANSIIAEQVQYSKNRRKKQPKAIPGPIAIQQDLSKQLAAATEYILIAEGSNPLTRFFARLLNPAIGGSEAARIRKYRMSLLTSATDTYKNLNKLQSRIVGSSPESIFESSKLLSKIEDNWSFLSNGFVTYKNTMPKDIKDVGGDISPKNIPVVVDDATYEAAKLAIKDYKKYIGNYLGLTMLPLNNLIESFIDAANEKDKRALSPQILIEYKKIVQQANVQQKTNGSSFEEIDSQTDNKPVTENNIDKVAQEFIKKWVGKTKHKISPFDKTSALRLDIYNNADECMKYVDKIMTSLEKEMDIPHLESIIKIVTDKLLNIRQLIKTLESVIKGKNFEKPFMNLLESGKITEFDPNLTEDQKKHLHRMLEQKQMRDLTNIYYNKK